MAAMTPPIIIVTTVFLGIISSFISSSEAAGRGTGGLLPARYEQSGYSAARYWGQNGWRREGSLRQTCQELNRNDVVIISTLNNFGYGQTPALDLGGHCDPKVSDCTYISGHITYCRSRGIRLYLSIGGDDINYGLESDAATNQLADYLWNNFLGGLSLNRPLGIAGLDGIDFNVQTSGRWDVLANRLKQKSWLLYQVGLSAAVQCRIPDPYLDKAIRSGVFDYIGVKFFGDPSCQYTTNAYNLLATWGKWVTYRGVNKLYLGIPGVTWVNGYISPDQLDNEILPIIQGHPKFGGVLFWSRFSRFVATEEDSNTTATASVLRLYTSNTSN